MKNIEIATAHNIIFKYELASTIQRILAFAIDGIILFFYSIFASIVFGGNTFFTITFILLVIVFYHLAFEVFNRGQSPGKMVVKLRVVTLRGTTPTVGDYFMRWVFRMVDILFSAGTLAIFTITGSNKNQRIGDLIAQTSVVSLRNNQNVSLKSLNHLDKEEIALKHPKLTQFSDEDMLLVKHTIQRYRLNQSSTNQKMVIDLSKEIISRLDLPKDTRISVDFLRRILKEYIILTR